MRLRSSFHSFTPYDLDSSTLSGVHSQMKDASVAAERRPEPPTPTSSAWPPGILRTRATWLTCSMK